MMSEPNMTPAAVAGKGALSTRLNARQEEFKKAAPKDMQTLFQQRIDDLEATGITARAIDVGDAAPMFTLPSATGTAVSLGQLLEQGPVVLTWYRGGWCPYCNIALRAYQERLDEITAAGATFVAITPETPDNSLTTADKNALAFEVLSDQGNRVAADYGVVFTLTDDLAKIYNDRFDLAGYNGDDSNTLPLAATYVIDTRGVVRWAFVDEDYRVRAEPQDVIDALRALQPANH